jgi:putative oxidoreductase
MKAFPYLSTNQWLTFLRVAVSIMMAAHGCICIYAGTVGGFGEFLDSKGFPFGTAIAWGITIFEITGGLLLAMDKLKKLICILFIVELVMGMILVHLANGWFVVGYTLGGIEYSVLLVICLFLIASKKH